MEDDNLLEVSTNLNDLVLSPNIKELKFDRCFPDLINALPEEHSLTHLDLKRLRSSSEFAFDETAGFGGKLSKTLATLTQQSIKVSHITIDGWIPSLP